MAEEEGAIVTNVTIVDKWTPVHVLSGMIAGWMNVPLPMFLATFAAFEVLEYGLEHKGFPALGTKNPEALANVAGDLAAASIGYMITKK